MGFIKDTIKGKIDEFVRNCKPNPVVQSMSVSEYSLPPDDQQYRDEVKRYYDEMDKINRLWSVVSNLGDFNGERAQELEKMCIDDIYYFGRMKSFCEIHDYEVPKHVPAYVRLCMLYEKQQRWEEAMHICEEAIVMDATEDGTKGSMFGRMARISKKSGIPIKENIMQLM